MRTIQDLITDYQQSRKWDELKPNSKRSYNHLLSCLQDRSGKPLEMLDTGQADRLYEELSFIYGSYRAGHIIKVLRTIWAYGLRRGYVQSNPFSGMGIGRFNVRTERWTDEQVERYFRASEVCQKRSMGILAYLCYDLCQRPGDMRQLVWANYRDGVLTFTQEKTGTTLSLPVENRTRTLLEAGQEQNPMTPIVKSETTGRMYQERHMALLHRRIKKLAGLPDDLQLRDLRRSGATELAEHGATEDEIRAVTGHKSRQILNTYVVVSQKLAGNAMNRRFGAGKN